MSTDSSKIKEEKRRVFWAIWEMDVFASTIRRTPTAIDWSQMEVFLPATDEDWFQGRAPTGDRGYMDVDPSRRWRVLHESESVSSKSWFLVINSYMKEAQMISNPRGLPCDSHCTGDSQTTDCGVATEEARHKLETLSNAVNCFTLVLPPQLNYRDQPLRFDPPVPNQVESGRQRHCAVYNIFVMTQLARLMISRYEAFGPLCKLSRSDSGLSYSDHEVARSTPINSSVDVSGVALRQYFEAADGILRIVNHSSEEHIQYINPFLSSTIWLASAVQLVRMYFVRSPSHRQLLKSRFDVLYLTYKRCIQFWDTRTAMQQNLELLEEQLDGSHGSHPRYDVSPSQRRILPRFENAQSFLPVAAAAGNFETCRRRLPEVATQSQQTSSRGSMSATSNGTNNRSVCVSSGNDDAGISTIHSPYLPDSGAPWNLALKDPVSGHHIMTPDSASGPPGFHDLMTLSRSNNESLPGQDIPPGGPLLLDPELLTATEQDVELTWASLDFPSGLQDLLNSFSTY
jgi:hypothetical protein